MLSLSLSVMRVSLIFPPPMDLSIWFLTSVNSVSTRRGSVVRFIYCDKHVWFFRPTLCSFQWLPLSSSIRRVYSHLYLPSLCCFWYGSLLYHLPSLTSTPDAWVIIHFLLLSIFHIRSFCVFDNPCCFFSLFYFCNILKQYRNHDLYFILESCWPLELFGL